MSENTLSQIKQAAEKALGEPVAWIIPGDDNANMDGFIDARMDNQGEFSMPVYSQIQVDALIASHEARERELVEALKVFADEAAVWVKNGDNYRPAGYCGVFSVGNLRRAAIAIAKGEGT